jgi:hypothetical protein
VIQGEVSSKGVPTISIPIAGSDWPATVDTGFNGDLELPEALRGLVNPRYEGRVASALAGGQIVREDAFRVDFPFDGLLVEATATFVPAGNILIGTKLLKDHRLLIRFVQKTVELERE